MNKRDFCKAGADYPSTVEGAPTPMLNDLAKKYPEKVQQLEAKLETWKNE